MEVLKTILMIAFIIICLAIIVIILMQEGKSAGLGSLSGQTSETYWSKNKGTFQRGNACQDHQCSCFIILCACRSFEYRKFLIIGM